MTYDPSTTGLLLVDPYNDFLSEGGKVWPRVKAVAEQVNLLDNLRRIVKTARGRGFRIFFVPHHRWGPGDYVRWRHPTPYQLGGAKREVFARGSWGGTFHEDFQPQDGDIVVHEHWGSSGFANTDLDLQLKQFGISHVILIGIIANTCIETTGRFAAELGYHVTLVKDATAAFSPEAMHAAHEINGPTYAHAIVTTDELIASGKEGEAMPSRRSLLSYAALAGGVLPIGRVSATGRTPEFVGIDAWLNTDRPLTLAAQRGRVVLVEFGTYTCINWRRTLPYVNRWHAEYGPQGLQLITVHTPEFGFERNRVYVESAIRELGVRNPLAQDNEFQTWRAFSNGAWPAFYLLDTNGSVRLVREGEGHAREIEAAIRSLLRLPRAERTTADDADLSGIRTPEMYFGSLHPTLQDPAQSPRQGEATYAIARPGAPQLNEYQLDGTWARGEEPLVLRSPRGLLRVRFSAAKLHLVAGSPTPAPVRVTVDGGAPRSFEIGMPTLYTLFDGDRYGEHVLDVECSTPGFSLFSATFG